MLVKLGVDISRLHRQMRRALPTVEVVYQEVEEEAVITSTYEGNHSVGSLHYAHKAVDFRFPLPPSRPTVISQLTERLGPNYDVVLSPKCIHIEFDPK